MVCLGCVRLTPFYCFNEYTQEQLTRIALCNIMAMTSLHSCLNMTNMLSTVPTMHVYVIFDMLRSRHVRGLPGIRHVSTCMCTRGMEQSHRLCLLLFHSSPISVREV